MVLKGNYLPYFHQVHKWEGLLHNKRIIREQMKRYSSNNHLFSQLEVQNFGRIMVYSNSVPAGGVVRQEFASTDVSDKSAVINIEQNVLVILKSQRFKHSSYHWFGHL